MGLFKKKKNSDVDFVDFDYDYTPEENTLDNEDLSFFNFEETKEEDDIQEEVLIEEGNTKKKKKSKTKKQPKPNMFTSLVEVVKYDEGFNASLYWKICLISIFAAIGIGVLFKLNILLIGVVVIADFICTPKVIIAVARNRYEEQKFQEATGYIEQMLYSFRRNSKILTSLGDAATVFPSGLMNKSIEKAMSYIRNAQGDGNIYEKAFGYIEKEYMCRRIASLHRYLTKVEGSGGSHDLGVTALLNDRRLWIERNEEFKKEKSSVQKEIIISSIFSTIIILITMYMLPEYVGALEHIITRVASTIYIIVNFLTVTAAYTKTINYLNDIESEEHERYMAKKLRWYKDYNPKREQKKAMMPAMLLILIAVVGVFLKIIWVTGICLLLACVVYFIQPKMIYSSTRKSLVAEIEKTYPDWLLELSLLLQTDNLHNALEKTTEEAPLILHEDLIDLANGIAENPTEIDPYNDFLKVLPVPNVHSSMRLLYSISEFGAHDEEKQIAELIERNASLMNKAEIAKNNSKLSVTYMLKFIPLGSSALMLIASMLVFIILFISSSLASVA